MKEVGKLKEPVLTQENAFQLEQLGETVLN